MFSKKKDTQDPCEKKLIDYWVTLASIKESLKEASKDAYIQSLALSVYPADSDEYEEAKKELEKARCKVKQIIDSYNVLSDKIIEYTTSNHLDEKGYSTDITKYYNVIKFAIGKPLIMFGR